MSFTSLNLNLFAPRCPNNRVSMDSKAASFFLVAGAPEYQAGISNTPPSCEHHCTVTKTGNTDTETCRGHVVVGGIEGAGTNRSRSQVEKFPKILTGVICDKQLHLSETRRRSVLIRITEQF